MKHHYPGKRPQNSVGGSKKIMYIFNVYDVDDDVNAPDDVDDDGDVVVDDDDDDVAAADDDEDEDDDDDDDVEDHDVKGEEDDVDVEEKEDDDVEEEHFARACAVETHVKISGEPLYTNLYAITVKKTSFKIIRDHETSWNAIEHYQKPSNII